MKIFGFCLTNDTVRSFVLDFKAFIAYNLVAVTNQVGSFRRGLYDHEIYVKTLTCYYTILHVWVGKMLDPYTIIGKD